MKYLIFWFACLSFVLHAGAMLQKPYIAPGPRLGVQLVLWKDQVGLYRHMKQYLHLTSMELLETPMERKDFDGPVIRVEGAISIQPFQLGKHTAFGAMGIDAPYSFNSIEGNFTIKGNNHKGLPLDEHRVISFFGDENYISSSTLRDELVAALIKELNALTAQ